MSRNLQHLAWVDQRESDCRVVVDRRRGERFARCANPAFSLDGKTVAYFAAREAEDPPRVHLVVDDAASPVEVGNEGPVALADSGGAWAAVAPARAPATGKTSDGAAGTPPPRRMIAFGPAGAFGEYTDTTSPVVSPDGAHAAWIASDADGLHSLIVDGKLVRAFGRPRIEVLPALKESKSGPNLEPEAMIRYLPDGTLAGVALGEQGWTVFHGGETWAAYPGLRMPAGTGFEVGGSPLLPRPAIMAGSLVAAAAAPIACWWERLEGDIDQWRVVCNAKPVDQQVCSAPGPGQPITPTPDGRTVMYVCQITGPPGADGLPDPKNLWVVVGGEKRGPHRFVWGLDLTPDGRHAAFAAADSIDDPWFYDFDGKRFAGPWQHAFPPKISPDGRSLAWAASPSADGNRVDLVRDGDVVARGDMVMAPPLWRADGRVEFALKRGRSVRRVVID